MELNNKQIKFLFIIGTNRGECIRKLGRLIYQTDVSCYNVRDKLLSKNLIFLENVRNREVPHLTKKGKKLISELSSKQMDKI